MEFCMYCGKPIKSITRREGSAVVPSPAGWIDNKSSLAAEKEKAKAKRKTEKKRLKDEANAYKSVSESMMVRGYTRHTAYTMHHAPRTHSTAYTMHHAPCTHSTAYTIHADV
jgi:hypothetical protein